MAAIILLLFFFIFLEDQDEFVSSLGTGMRLKEQLKGIIPEEKLKQLSNRFHVIGDIAIVSISPEMDIYKNEIARTIISRHKNIKTVLNKVSKVHGDHRVASLETLAGDRTVTVHKEFGFYYKLDVGKVFFNSHLSYERKRVASKVRPYERVLVPFCGVGPFAIPIAAKGLRVLGLEKNMDACRWLSVNARLNRVEEKIDVLNGDAFNIADLLKWKNVNFDRIIIPTPYGLDNILETISPLVKRGGIIHFYTFKKRYQIEGLNEKYEDMNLNVEFYRKCGNVAPGVSRWVFDLIKS
jgi:tRNA (guanine37-N1)-methyltransferase